MINTREEARAYWNSRGLITEYITELDINLLHKILIRHLFNHQQFVMELNIPKYEFAINSKGNPELKNAYFSVSGRYFDKREGIRIEPEDELVFGFAGWADEYNIKPFLLAFEEWVDCLVGDGE
jgi:hypothetical protein